MCNIDGIENTASDKPTKAELKKADILNKIVLAISVILAAIGIILTFNIIKLLRVNESYTKALAEVASQDNSYVSTSISEIMALQNEFGLKQDVDYDNCNEVAITYYVLAMDDKYSVYHSPKNTEILTGYDIGRPTGLGFKVVYAGEDGIYIHRVFDGSSAYKAGVKPGDYIVQIGDTKVSDIEYIEALKLLKGEIGDEFDITVNRDGELISFKLAISDYETTSIFVNTKYDDVAIISIDEFSFIVKDNFIKTMKNLKELGYNNFIVDLRNNTGGHLVSVVEMLDFLVGKGLIVEITNKDGEVTESINSDANEFDGNIVVLVNENTASASELFAQTIQDFNKGKVVGTKTFGKGTVLTEYTLSTGGTVSLSTGLYTTNSGRFLEENGVDPDYVVELDKDKKDRFFQLSEEEDEQLQKAIEVVRTM